MAAQRLPDTDSHLEVLRVLQAHPEYSQRQLSAALGVSLGKTHYLLKALLDKGLVKANNFRRSGRKLAFLYILTPHGVRHRTELTRQFLASKELQFESLKKEIEALRREAETRPPGSDER